MNFDLHTHTNFSMCADKNNSWENLLIKAQSKGIEFLSITDHDTCIFHVLSQFKDVAEYFKGKIISGMECDVVDNGIAFELLAYNFNVLKVFNWAYKTYGTFETRQTLVKDRLVKKVKALGLRFDYNQVYNGKKEYAHNFVYNNLKSFKENDVFFSEHNINTSSLFYRKSTGDKSFPLYQNLSDLWPTPKKVVKAIHKAGGIVVLAHPYNYNEKVDPNELLNIALENKIDGIEVYHPSCNNKQIKFLLEFAKRHNLIVTGGSDYHANERHNTIGIQDIKNDKYVPNFLTK